MDITGCGRLDIVILESEYMDGRLSWFENRMKEDPLSNPWVEHTLKDGLVFAHSLSVLAQGEETFIFAGEMEKGGWDAPYNHDARLLLFTTSSRGAVWSQECIARGEGTHQAVMVKKSDGKTVAYGKTWGNYWHNGKLQMWKRPESQVTVAFEHSYADRDKPHAATDILTADIDGDGLPDIVCGKWWYKNPTWERREIPHLCQVINAWDIDGDGAVELIGIRASSAAGGFYKAVQRSVLGEACGYGQGHLGMSHHRHRAGRLAPRHPCGSAAARRQGSTCRGLPQRL